MLLARRDGESGLAIHMASEVDSLGTCHMVFLCSSESRSVDAVLERYRDQSVLTVADIEGFAQRAGIIDMNQRRSDSPITDSQHQSEDKCGLSKTCYRLARGPGAVRGHRG